MRARYRGKRRETGREFTIELERALARYRSSLRVPPGLSVARILEMRLIMSEWLNQDYLTRAYGNHTLVTPTVAV